MGAPAQPPLPAPPAPSLTSDSHRAVIYLNIQVVKGQRKVICLLKEQISNVSAPLTTPTPGGAPYWLTPRAPPHLCPPGPGLLCWVCVPDELHGRPCVVSVKGRRRRKMGRGPGSDPGTSGHVALRGGTAPVRVSELLEVALAPPGDSGQNTDAV